jgi:hypothetical protein
MSKGYFSHNVFERIDACNRTTTYFKDNQVEIHPKKKSSINLSRFSYSIANYLQF